MIDHPSIPALTLTDNAGETIHVRTDAAGRFCLNDLHKAAGGLPKHRPGLWLRADQTIDLIAELETAQIRAVCSIEGRNGGTYVAKELVYAYAMWISPAFHLKVIRAYDDMVMGNRPQAPEFAIPTTPGNPGLEQRRSIHPSIHLPARTLIPSKPSTPC